MPKILGLDLGTASIGWALRNTELKTREQLEDYGVLIYSKGVGEGKSGEFSLSKERTDKRSIRKSYRRRKLRKRQVLSVLIDNDMCPLSRKELDKWTKKTKGERNYYPTANSDFEKWIAKNPLEIGVQGLSKKLGLEDQGRIFYYLAQRRGFKSNRIDISENSKAVDEERMSAFKEKFPDKTVIEVHYDLAKEGNRFRGETSEDIFDNSRFLYEEYFEKLCLNQSISGELKAALHKALFFQRPLKSQKHTVGKCILEPNKTRCQLSTIEYELFRMYSLVNNIQYFPDANKSEKRPLSEEHRDIAIEKFFRKKKTFPFSDISKAINKEAKKKVVFSNV